MNQWEIEANTYNSRQARENTSNKKYNWFLMYIWLAEIVARIL